MIYGDWAGYLLRHGVVSQGYAELAMCIAISHLARTVQ